MCRLAKAASLKEPDRLSLAELAGESLGRLVNSSHSGWNLYLAHVMIEVKRVRMHASPLLVTTLFFSSASAIIVVPSVARRQ